MPTKTQDAKTGPYPRLTMSGLVRWGFLTGRVRALSFFSSSSHSILGKRYEIEVDDGGRRRRAWFCRGHLTPAMCSFTLRRREEEPEGWLDACLWSRWREQCGGVDVKGNEHCGGIEGENRQSARRHHPPSANQRAPKLRIYGLFAFRRLLDVRSATAITSDGRTGGRTDALLAICSFLGVDATHNGKRAGG